MPELPEVETVCRGLSKVLPGHTVATVSQNRKDLRIPFPANLGDIKGKKINTIARRAKYILIHLNNKQTLIIHLGMSGRLLLQHKKDKPKAGKHDHLVLTMSDGTHVTFNDPRRFGLVALTSTKDLEDHKLFQHLGPEPLGKDFTAAYLAKKLENKKVAIKLALMDQRLVVGVGNIYASEALFLAGIDPRRAAGSLSTAEVKRLVPAVQKVLKEAIKAGGSSLRDYVQTDGELGYFQHHFAVYDRENKACKNCRCAVAKTGGVRRLTQGGRSTFYCPVKQA